MIVPSSDPGSDDGIVIAGAGHAGGRAAETLRRLGYRGSVTLIGEEPRRPYERPPLSKQVLLDDTPPEPFLRAEGFYEQQGIDLSLGEPVVAIDLRSRTATKADGREIRFGKLLIATGGRPRRLPHLETGPLPFLYLRDLEDAFRLRQCLAAGTRVIIVGAGVIGLEIAAAARKRGASVTVIEAADRVMARIVCPAISAWIAARHRAEGVELLTNATAASVISKGVCLTDGRIVPGDSVFIGVGIEPNQDFAAAAGIETDDGIVIDEFGRTSAPDIFATGDVACRYVPQYGRRLRIETWANAQNHAIAVASSMLGEPQSDPEPPWYWTDQFDFNLQVAGAPMAETDVVRGDVSSRSYTLFHLSSGRVVGATCVNNRREMALARRLVRDMCHVDPKDLENIAFDLRKAAKDQERRSHDAEQRQTSAFHQD